MQSVSTWISKVDLALRGAKLSGRGDWTDEELYYIVGNKLQESAARWWVQMDEDWSDAERTWSNLKTALLRRYGERPDKATAEWRVSLRRMMPGETYADFAAGLRDAAGRNKVKERILLAQFYRNLDKTTRQLVRQRPKPKTLEEAVDKATEIDDPIDNVAQGMQNIGQAWATAPNPYMIPMDGTTGQVMVIPGVGGTGVPAEQTIGTMAEPEESIAYFTNPQGVYNKFSGTWDVPEGRQWNGRYWARTSRRREQNRRKEHKDRRSDKNQPGDRNQKAR
ncbi:Hypothetical protein PHPALM_16625, partial [Phytophthora palmivora]